MKKHIDILCILILLSATAAMAQERLVKIQQQKIILEASEARPMPSIVLDQPMQLKGIVVKSGEQQSQLFVENLETGELTLIDEFSTMRKNPAVRLSGRSRYVSCNEFHPDRTVTAKIYDLETGKVIQIKHPDGQAGYADINPQNGKILYQVFYNRQIVKVYLADENGGNPQFVTEGTGARWSPDGKWFYLVHRSEITEIQDSSVSSKRPLPELSRQKRKLPERRKPVKLGPRKIEFFDANGKTQFEINLFLDPSHIVWSPESDRIVLRDRKEGKVCLLSFLASGNVLQFQKSEELLRDTPYGEYFEDPVWSSDGKKLLFNKFKDSHYGFENIDVVLFDLETRTLVSLTTTPDTLERVMAWNADGSIFIKKENKAYEPLRLEKIILEH